MGVYNIVSPGAMIAGQPEDISPILANFNAIAAILNGGIDNSNINAAAAIAASKLAGYPSDGTKVFKGDGTWGTVTPVSYRKTTVKAINTTVAATDLLNGEITVAAGAMGLTGALRLHAWGDFLNNSGGAAAPPRFQLILGGTTLLDTGATGTTTVADAVRRGWELNVIILNTGAANAQTSRIKGNIFVAATAANIAVFTTGAGAYMLPLAGSSLGSFEGVNLATAVDTSLARLLELRVINGSANAAYETKLFGALAQIL